MCVRYLEYETLDKPVSMTDGPGFPPDQIWSRAIAMTPEPLPFHVARRRVNGLDFDVAEHGPLDGPLVILLHGFPDLWQGWHLQIGVLADAGFRVLAPNQRGYGGSDKPRHISDYDLDVLADDVIGLACDEKRATFSLVGHDWGGVVAWWAAARYPQQVERVAILSAPHPGVFKSYMLRNPVQLMRSSYAGFFQLPWLPEWVLSAHDFALLFRAVQSTSRPGTFDESDRRYLYGGWTQPGSLTAMLNYYRALARRRERTLRQRVHPPVLLLCGQDDPAVEPGLVKAGAACCDEVRIVEIPNARHWIQREAATRVNEELRSFLTLSTNSGR